MSANTANIDRMRELAENVRNQHADLMPNVDAYEDALAAFWETYKRAFAARPENEGGAAKLIAEWEQSNYERQLRDLASKLQGAMFSRGSTLYKSDSVDRLYDVYMPVSTTARAVRTWRTHLTRCNNHQAWLLKELDTAIASRDFAAMCDVANDNSWATFDINAEKGLKLIIGWADIANGAIINLRSHSLNVEAEYGISLENKLERELGVSLESDGSIAKLLSDCVLLAESQLDELSGKPNATFCALWRTRVLGAIEELNDSIAPKTIRALEFVQNEHKAVPKEMLADLPTPEQFAASIDAS